MDNDMRNGPGPTMSSIGNMQNALTAKETVSTIKGELDRLACSINESRELLSGLDSFTNEICGPEDAKVQPEVKDREPISLLEHIEMYNRQYREVNGRLAKACMRLRETLG